MLSACQPSHRRAPLAAAGLVLAMLVLGAVPAWSHGGGGGGGRGGFGGGYGGGMRGGMPGGFGGGGMSMPRDMGGGRDFGGGFDGRGLDGGGRLDGGRELAGGDRGLDTAGRGLDGRDLGDGAVGRGFDGAGRDLGAGHFAGAGEMSRADFQRIANRGLPGVGVGGAAVRPYSSAALINRGTMIRNNFYGGGWYGGRGWYGDHFNAWWPGGWWGGFGWGMVAGLAWGDLAGWGGYGAAPVAYNYGTSVCYQNDGVYVQGERVGSAEEYAQQASDLAGQGLAATPPDDDQWRPLGVYALARAQETTPSTFMSLAIDKGGLLRGTYYDAVSDTTTNMAGKVDKKTQKAAWTIGDKKTPVYEAGLSNLTKQQTTILVHRDGGKVEQMLLVRVDDKAGGAAAAAKQPAAAPAPAAP
ncbi:MAG: hypothetical protein ACKO1M_01720 [Planctomycetota bacterium]